MKFIVQDEIKKLGIKILEVEIHGLDNTSYNEEFETWRNNKVNEFIKKYKDYGLSTVY